MKGLVLALLLFAPLPAWAQSQAFQPGAGPVSNQAWNAAAIVVATPFAQVSRAIYNGNASACNITVTMNGGTSVQFQNVGAGQILPIQATVVSASSCSNLLVLY